MATSVKELHGTVGIYFNSVLGSGTYGRVCKAKCGLLPCVVKVFHKSLFPPESSNKDKVLKFEEECKHLSTIRHPNLVQYLGTEKDPNTLLPLLFMEILDEDLTQFLRNSAGPLPYHLQVNISYDMGLGVAYLHFNSLIHGALSSNNVLVIGEASRAKLADFGLYKFVDAENLVSDSNGTLPYMAPESVSQPPTYSNQTDCFSYGVVLLQILTRKLPELINANKEVKITEIERRKKDIRQVDPSHQLLPIILGCLKDKNTERLSADQICERIALLKKKTLYQNSQDEHFTSLEGLQQNLHRKEKLLEICNQQIQTMKAKHERKENDRDLARREVDSVTQPSEGKKYNTPPGEVAKCEETTHTTDDKSPLPALALAALSSPLQDQHKVDALDATQPGEQIEIKAECSPSQDKSCDRGGNSCDPADIPCEPDDSSCDNSCESSEDLSMEDHTPSEDEKWSVRSPAPETMGSLYGAAVVRGKTVYFSRHYNIYSYKLSQDKWSKLMPSDYQNFSLVVLNDRLTTIGGITRDLQRTKALFSVSKGKWKELYSPAPTHRVCAAALTTSTHLMVAGGRNKSELQSIEVMDIATGQWFSAPSGLPESMGHPQMVLCNGHLYICSHQSIYSMPMDSLLKSCLEESESGNFWKKKMDLPLCMGGASLVTLEEEVVAIGGHDANDNATRDICLYDKESDSWKVVEEMPTPRGDVLTASLPGNLVVIVGGWSELQFYARTDIARLNFTN